MPKHITAGRRLIPHAHIAYVEPFDPAANPDFHLAREFHARVVMLNRDDSLLIEETSQTFAAANGFRMLNADRIATNPAVRFRVESFLPTEGFTPGKAYATRLLWRDLDGNEQSKLLLSEPETVLRVVVEGETDTPLLPEGTPRRCAAGGRWLETARDWHADTAAPYEWKRPKSPNPQLSLDPMSECTRAPLGE